MYNDRRLNNLELSYFTAKLGELLMFDGRIVNSYSYEKGTEEQPIPKECFGLRKWGDCKFHDATLQYSKAWTSEKVYEDLVQIFGEDMKRVFLAPALSIALRTASLRLRGY